MGNTAYLGLGANIGSKEATMRSTLRMLRESGCVVTAVSSLYVTAPVGPVDQPEFLNAVVQIDTTFSPRALLGLCQAIELRHGRERTIRWGPRVIDIDILLYDEQSICEEDLIVPHPGILERAFVLVPLAEIAPDAQVADGLTAREAAERVDASGVQRIQDESWAV